MADARGELGSVFGCEGTRASETMMRAVVVFVGRARFEAQRPVTTAQAARKRPKAPLRDLSPGGAMR